MVYLIGKKTQIQKIFSTCPVTSMNKKSDILILVFLFLLFVGIRTIHFTEHLNFSFDQAWTSTRVMEIWKNKEITLVGPGSSLVVNNKNLLQGALNYYFQLPFMLAGNWDPVLSSFSLMVYMGLMVFPLYFGVKLLSNKKAAIFVVILYSFLPYFIDFTRFFFGPVYQLSVMALIILFMGLYQKYKKWLYLFLVFFLTGVSLQIHYQTMIVIVILSVYYFFREKNKLYFFVAALLGLFLGYLPMIVFELKNKFYNFQIIQEYLQSSKKSTGSFSFSPHRYLSISLLLLALLTRYCGRFLSAKIILLAGLILFLLDLTLYVPLPGKGFGMSEHWNYPMEKKAYEIIKQENLKNYNIANLVYDNLSVVIKYLLKRDGLLLQYDDYYNNHYLFVIDKNEASIRKNPAYEVATFSPRKKIKKWELNKKYNLYLFERIKQ